MSKNNICNNCGKQGHQYHNCKLPITSYGMIVFMYSDKDIKYLMIRRKNSFGYIDFIRGKYIANNLEHLEVLFNEMSLEEKELIRNNNFDILWKTMWGIQESGHHTKLKGEEYISQKKFETLKNGLQIGQNGEIVTLDNLIDNSTTKWLETEWEFPKGRRNNKEKDIECAMREFEEETGISKNNITIVENVMSFEEIFIGTNYKSYKHKYFLAHINDNEDVLNNYQVTEVSKIEWKTIDECLKSIRPYNLEKKKLIANINNILQEYRLYS